MSQRPGPSVRGKALGLGAVALLLWLAGSAVFRGGPDQKPGPLAPGIAARPPGTAALIERLRRTTLRNGDEIYRRLDLGDASFFDAPEVRRWHSSRRGNTEVCAVGFVDPDRVDYRLRTFPDRESALAEGYAITHRDHCGSCSSLWNLAVYLEHPDLTSPVRNCARRWTAGGVKACLMEEIGFEEHCAATWGQERPAHQASLSRALHRALRSLERADGRHPRPEHRRRREPESLSGVRRARLRPGFPVRGGTDAAEFRPDLGHHAAPGGDLPGRSHALLPLAGGIARSRVPRVSR